MSRNGHIHPFVHRLLIRGEIRHAWILPKAVTTALSRGFAASLIESWTLAVAQMEKDLSYRHQFKILRIYFCFTSFNPLLSSVIFSFLFYFFLMAK